MQVIENMKVKEKLYIEKLDNGLSVMIIPKKVYKRNMLFGVQIMVLMIASLLYLVIQRLQRFQMVWHIFWSIRCLNKKW